MTEVGLCLQNRNDNKLSDAEGLHRPVTAHRAYSPHNNCTMPHTVITGKQTVPSGSGSNLILAYADVDILISFDFLKYF